MVGDYQYSCKVLTHVIRLSDGHVMPDWIDCKPSQADDISKRLRNREFDTDNYAVRIRRSPKSRHAKDVELWTDEKEFWQKSLYRESLLVIQRKNMKPTLKQIMRQTMLLRKFRKEWEAEIMQKGMEETNE